MKTLKERINEGKQVKFTIAFNDFVDNDGMPIGVTAMVDGENAKAFDKFLADQEGNMFAHACGDLDTCY